jgi:hypothetical protein
MFWICFIAVYILIGIIFVFLTEADEESVWCSTAVVICWPILLIILSVCFVVFSFIELKKVVKKNYE